MKNSFICQCGAGLFFGNTGCVVCGAAVGWCDACRQTVTLLEEGSNLVCGNPQCQQNIKRCQHFVEHQLCNCCFPLTDDADLCRSCRLTVAVPDLADPENVARLRKLERAKRRLLMELNELGLPYDEFGGAAPSLSFVFKADLPNEQVLTGHADGVVTINLAEADSVQREMLRRQFGEPQRTLIGHFRHEVGHYYWMTLVEPAEHEEFVRLFGDPNEPPYADALIKYYADGPAADWQPRFISAYASAHPWEDFAETFAFYLDMRAVLSTVHDFLPEFGVKFDSLDLTRLLGAYQGFGVIANEINRTMGLTDLLPEVVGADIVPKIEFVHRLVTQFAPSSPELTAIA